MERDWNTPSSASSILQSGQTGFLKKNPTLLGQQFSQKTLRHFGHCHAGGFRNPPIVLLQRKQYPLTNQPPHSNVSENLSSNIHHRKLRRMGCVTVFGTNQQVHP